jgi:alginate O-acetyltransferase complex protein AlgI
MTEGLISLNAPPFWITLAVAIVALNLINGRTIRQWAFAAINLGFLSALAGWYGAGLIGALVLMWLLLHAVQNRFAPNTAMLVLAAATLWLFLLHKGLPLPALPNGSAFANLLSVVGISFVTLRVVEVVRAVADGRYPTPNFPMLVNYLVPFHMLAAGPVQAYDDFVAGLDDANVRNARDVLTGVERIAWGLFKKFVIAFMLKEAFLTDFRSNGLYMWIELQVFLVWLYIDFSAYSDIAFGIGRLIGVATPENFKNPLFARNLIDFWERWHISLSMFIRRNLFIPIQLFLMRNGGGSRRLLCAAVAIFVAFEVCGLWHGLSLAWLAWGALHSLGLMAVRTYSDALEKALGPQRMKIYRTSPKVRVASTLVTFEYLAVTFLPLFQASS